MTTATSSRGLNFAVLRPYLARRKGLFALALAVIVAGVGLQLWIPLLLKDFIDGSLAGADVGRLAAIAVIYLSAGLVAQVLSVAAAYLGTSIGWSVANELRLDAARHVASLDLDYHSGISPGSLIERVDGDVDAVAKMFSQFAVQVVSATLLLGGIFVLTFLEHVVAGWTVVAFTAVLAGAMYLLRAVAVSATSAERGSSAELFGFIEERLSAIEDIRANGAGRFVMRRFQPVMRRYYQRSVGAWIRRSIIWTTSIGLFSAGTLVALAVGSWLVLRGSVTLGVAFLLITYMAKLEDPVMEVTDQMQEVQKAAAGLGRLGELFAEQPTVPRRGERRLPSGPLKVQFDHVDFTYGAEPVLTDITFELAAGRHLGLLGRTGSGKSTIAKLISRFYDASGGRICLGDVPIVEVAEPSLRSRVAVITQDVQLFEGTVKDNVTMFAGGVPDRAIVAALEEIGMGIWLDGLTEGIDTRLDSGTTSLSSGEAQLVALARAYLLDPGIVILDEPSSRIDPATEAVLAAALDRLLRNRTAVIIAHRLETVGRVDELLILDGGSVIEHGSRDELMANPDSAFGGLLQAAREGMLYEEVDL